MEKGGERREGRKRRENLPIISVRREKREDRRIRR